MPSMWNSASARAVRATASAKFGDGECAISLASKESKWGLVRAPTEPQVSTRTPGPDGTSKVANVPPRGRAAPSAPIVSVLIRTSIA